MPQSMPQSKSQSEPQSMSHEELRTAMQRHGGVCDLAALRTWATDHAIRAALRDGAIVRPRRGRYALPTAQQHRVVAHTMSAVLSHTSAAAHWGWAMKHVPTRPTVTVRHDRKVSGADRARADVSWRALPAYDVTGGVTSPLRTVVDCALTLPFDEALAVADSALRGGDVTRGDLRTMVDEMRGPGRGRVRTVVEAASAQAANPFESVLRAISMGVPGLDLRPQVVIADTGLFVCPDLVDEPLQIVAEADSFAHHGSRRALADDCERYDELVVRGWIVLRFAWEQVMSRPQWVAGCLRAVVALRAEPAEPRRRARRGGRRRVSPV